METVDKNKDYLISGEILASWGNAIRDVGNTAEDIPLNDVEAAIYALRREGLPQLFAPTATLSGDIVTITDNADNGAFAENFAVMVDGEIVGLAEESMIGTWVAKSDFSYEGLRSGANIGLNFSSTHNTYNGTYSYVGFYLLGDNLYYSTKSNSMDAYACQYVNYNYHWKGKDAPMSAIYIKSEPDESASYIADWVRNNFIKQE